MFCKKCGKFVPDGKEKCVYCGSELEEKQTVQTNQYTKSKDNDKTIIGVLLSLFLGIIGLVVGLLIYPTGKERETFLSGWTKCFIVCVILGVILGLVYSCVFFSLI